MPICLMVAFLLHFHKYALMIPENIHVQELTAFAPHHWLRPNFMWLCYYSWLHVPPAFRYFRFVVAVAVAGYHYLPAAHFL